jgi:hypothetical protein
MAIESDVSEDEMAIDKNNVAGMLLHIRADFLLNCRELVV